jgi:heme exporter protein B
MSAWWRIAWAVARHDLVLELRRPVALSGVALFGAGSLVTLHLALAGSGRVADGVAAGALWVVLLYGALLGGARAIGVEREEGTWDALLLAAADRSAVAVGKTLAAAVLALVLHAVLVPAYLALFGAPPDARGMLLLAAAVLLADAGFAVVGVLVGTLSLRARGRELLGAAIFVPLSLPLVIAAVTLSLEAWRGGGDASPAQLLAFLAAYDATFLAAAVAAVPEIAVE